MNASKKNFALTNGWILCPSKSFPGKFYYFNVLNGEAAWSLNEADKKVLPKDPAIHKVADKSHNYPEPTTLPDDTSILSTANIGPNFSKPDIQINIPYSQHLPTFGQASFPKYVANVEPLLPNIVWTPIQLPMPMYCQEMKKPMIDEVTQTSEAERELFIQTCDIPLCKRFKNYESPSLSFDKKNKIMQKPRPNFGTSTPTNNSLFNTKPESQFGVPKSKSLIKEPVLKLEAKSPNPKNPLATMYPNSTLSTPNSTLSTPNKIEYTKAQVQLLEGEVLENLDRTDLRFILLAKRRKSVDATVDGIIQCKKPRPNDLHTTPKKKVTFDVADTTDEDTVTEEGIQEDCIPGTMPTENFNLQEQKTPIACAKNDIYRDTPKSPLTPKTSSVLHLKEEQKSAITYTKSDTYRDTPKTALIANTKNDTYQEIPKTQLTPNTKTDTYQETPKTQLTASTRNNIYQKIPKTPLTPNTKSYTYRESAVSPLSPYSRNDTYPGISMSPPCGNITFIDSAIDLGIDQRKDKVLSMARNDVWYLVVDTDVLLLDYEFIDEIMLTDRKCRLLIPHAVRVDIEALCMGDCRGQQRVINARQLTRRLATPPAHYIVEPAPDDEDSILVTTDSILNCCVQAVNENRRVVLITNDPHLQNRATKLNIPNYKLNEIKNGVDPQPDTTSELKKIKISFNNDDTNKFNLFSQNKTDNIFNNNADGVKKQLFFNSEKSNFDCDKLINITKSKSSNRYDSDSPTADISRDVQNLNLKDTKILKQKNENNNPFSPIGFVNFEKKLLNSSFDYEKVNPNSKFSMDSIPNSNVKVNNLKKETKQNMQSSEKIYCSIPISNIKHNNIKNKFHFENVTNIQEMENSGRILDTNIPNLSRSLRHDPYSVSRENRPISATQARIQKLLSTINCTPSNTQDQLQKSNDTTIFKVPQPLQFKNRTKTSTVINNSATIDNRAREFKTIDNVEENLKRFCVKSKNMCEKIINRIDEWVCTYMQIMEDVLNYILQKNSECMKDTMAPLTLHDKLNCIKMLYGSHTNLRDAVDNVSEYLNKCICKKGTLNTSVKPDDFMKMLGYGVLLIQTLKAIQPSEELSDAESSLNSLLHNIESNSVEFDLDSLKAPSVSRTDLGNKDEFRPNFLKGSSYVLNYLKKHFKEWLSYEEVPSNHNYFNQTLNHSDYKVVRTFGKNLNMLKIDNNKAISLTKMASNDEPISKSKDTPKIIRLLDNPPIMRHKETIDNKEDGKKNDLNKEHKMIIDKIQEQNKLLTKPIQTINKESNNTAKVINDLDFTTNENTFSRNEEITGPKMIRKMQIIDEYEKKIINKEPLDLDLLDYSEIYEPSDYDDGNTIPFDVVSDKNENKGNNNPNHDDQTMNDDHNKTNYAVDFTEDVILSPNDDFYTSDSDNKNYKTNVTKNNIKNQENISTNNKTYENYDITDNNTIINVNINNNHNNTVITNKEIFESYDITDNNTIINVSNNNKTAKHNHASHNNNGNDITATENDNSIIHNDNFEKTALLERDDNTNDSGFENDSTYAHTVVKLFLKELSTSFKVICEFVNKFILEIRGQELCEMRINNLHDQASKSLEDMVAIIQRLRSIIKRESAEDTVLKTLLLKAGVEATTDKRMTRYRQIVMKSLEQAQILENALKIIVSTTIGDFDALSTNAESFNSSIRYFNIFE